jgi:hypothetical protein
MKSSLASEKLFKSHSMHSVFVSSKISGQLHGFVQRNYELNLLPKELEPNHSNFARC